MRGEEEEECSIHNLLFLLVSVRAEHLEEAAGSQCFPILPWPERLLLPGLPVPCAHCTRSMAVLLKAGEV